MTMIMEGLVATFLLIDEEIYHVKNDSYCGSKSRRQRMRGRRRRRRLCIVLLETRENKCISTSTTILLWGRERAYEVRMIPDVASFLANQNVLLSGELTRNGLEHNENRCWYLLRCRVVARGTEMRRSDREARVERLSFLKLLAVFENDGN
jgi:hypothetical protein